MKLQIRKNVFETNSSSTHSICIAKQKPACLPEKIYFGIDEYGWEWRILCGQEKANYLYTLILEQNDSSELLKRLVKMLDKLGVEYEFESPRYEDYYGIKCLTYGYVDHSSEGREFIDAVLHSDSRLARYLFSDGSFVKTGNDNDEGSVMIDVEYPHEEYYKGN